MTQETGCKFFRAHLDSFRTVSVHVLFNRILGILVGKQFFVLSLTCALRIFLVPDTEYPGTLEISTFYFIAVFVQLTLFLPDTRHPGFLLKSIIFLVCLYQKEQFVFCIFYDSHDTKICKLFLHDVDDFEYAPRITATTYLSFAIFVDTKTSRRLLICNMFLECCSEGQLKFRCSNVSHSKLQKKNSGVFSRTKSHRFA